MYKVMQLFRGRPWGPSEWDTVNGYENLEAALAALRMYRIEEENWRPVRPGNTLTCYKLVRVYTEPSL